MCNADEHHLWPFSLLHAGTIIPIITTYTPVNANEMSLDIVIYSVSTIRA